MKTDNTEYLKKLFEEWQRDKDERARTVLLEQIYADLHDLASAVLRRGPASEYTRTTQLAHDFIANKFVEFDGLDWRGRASFYKLLSKAMRRFLIDASRKKGAQIGIELPDGLVVSDPSPHAVYVYNEAIERLESIRAHWAVLVDSRVLLELPWADIEKCANADPTFSVLKERDIPHLKYEFRKAKAWLKRGFSDQSGERQAR